MKKKQKTANPALVRALRVALAHLQMDFPPVHPEASIRIIGDLSGLQENMPLMDGMSPPGNASFYRSADFTVSRW